jgi:hypothetical protein
VPPLLTPFNQGRGFFNFCLREVRAAGYGLKRQPGGGPHNGNGEPRMTEQGAKEHNRISQQRVQEPQQQERHLDQFEPERQHPGWQPFNKVVKTTNP